MQIVQKTNGRSMKRVLLSSALLLVSTLTFAQSKVSGTVKDANGEPLIGVSVMEVGTNNGAVTDINGNYTLNVKPGAKLKLSYIGFTPQTVKAGSNSQIVLQEDNTALNEVVVVGYGTMRRKDVTSSITTVKAEDLNQGVFTLNLFAVPGTEGKFSFLHLFVAPFSDIFFLRLPVASVVSFQVPFKGGEAGNTRFFGKRMTKKAKNSRFELLF